MLSIDKSKIRLLKLLYEVLYFFLNSVQIMCCLEAVLDEEKQDLNKNKCILYFSNSLLVLGGLKK
jgi:hypothetical protein